MRWPARMKSENARRPSEGAIHSLMVCDESLVLRHGFALSGHTVTMLVLTSMLPCTDFEYGQT